MWIRVISDFKIVRLVNGNAFYFLSEGGTSTKEFLYACVDGKEVRVKTYFGKDADTEREKNDDMSRIANSIMHNEPIVDLCEDEGKKKLG